MTSKINKRSYVITLIVFLVVLIDQITKYIVQKSMYLGEVIPVMGNFFRFNYIENPGMAFGLQIENKIIFTVLSIGAALVILVYLIKMRNQNIFLVTGLSFIMGGAVGNLIDRLFYGKVIDFLDFEFFDISIPQLNLGIFDLPAFGLTRWPIFNIADSSVTIGMFIITLMILFIKDKTKVESTS